MSSEHPEVAVLLRARNPMEAQIIAALLGSNGIPCFVGGQSLQDEFAISQRLLNLVEIKIEVPEDRVDEARDVLAQARRAGVLMREEQEEEPDDVAVEPPSPTPANAPTAAASTTEDRGHPEVAVLLKARNPMEAKVIAALLHSHGIRAHVPGQSLQDEFAVAQRALNLVGITVEVPSDQLDEARDVLAQARRVAAEMRADEDEEGRGDTDGDD